MKNIIIFLSMTLACHVSARNIIVDINGTGEFTEIQAAINVAQARDTITVKEGSYGLFYEERSSYVDFIGKAIEIKSENPEDEICVSKTVIGGTSGFQPGNAVSFRSGETMGSILNGFTIYSNQRAIFLDQSFPTIKNCVVYAKEYAIYNRYPATIPESNGWLVLENCIFYIHPNYSISSRINMYGLAADIVNCMFYPFPEGPTGEHCERYSVSDLNHDCKVNILDLAIMANEWLKSNWRYW
jgi:hypothetical protein